MTITGAGRTYCTRGADAEFVGADAGVPAGTCGSFGGRFASARRRDAASMFSKRLRRSSCADWDCVLDGLPLRSAEPSRVDRGDGAESGCEAEEDGDQ